MNKITKLPLSSIYVPVGTGKGYLVYDRIAEKVYVSEDPDITNAILRTGATLNGPIYYDDQRVTISEPGHIINYSYLEHQVNLLLADWEGYVPRTGGEMEGSIILASSSTGTSVATQKQVDTILNPTEHIRLSGGIMIEAFHLHSNKDSAYEKYDAIPKFLVDAKVNDAYSLFMEDLKVNYISDTGGTLTGALYSVVPSNPSEDGHVVTKQFVVNTVMEYVSKMDWSCSPKVRDALEAIKEGAMNTNTKVLM